MPGVQGLGGTLPLPCLREGSQRHSCVACPEALPKFPFPIKTQGESSCCIPRGHSGSGRRSGLAPLLGSLHTPDSAGRVLGGCLGGCWEGVGRKRPQND